ncbi:RNA-binding protein 43 [Polymixia lowei]
MEKRGIGIEVLDVPIIGPNERIVDKLLIHFLRPRHGGGEVKRVIYPSCRPYQALVIFEEPEVAARVLQHRPHVLEVDNQRFPLRVNAADRPEVDIPVEATLNISMFPNKAGVRQLLNLHGFEMTELARDQLRIKGSFMMLTSVKTHLEKLLKSQTKTQNSPSSSSPVLSGQKHSSGAIRKHYTEGSSKQTPPGYGVAQSLRKDQHPSTRPGSVSFAADADVFLYAQCHRKDDIAIIVRSHNVTLDEFPGGPGIRHVVVFGGSAKPASEKLQSLLDNLTKTLRTQEIPLADLDHDIQVKMAKQLHTFKDIYPSVAISQLEDKIRLIGPSADSYDMKQRLLGKLIVQSAQVRTGRTFDRGSRPRSSSLSRINSKEKTEAIAKTPPVGASGYSPSKYQDDKGAYPEEREEEAGALVKQNGGPRGRSHSESREKVLSGKAAASQRHEREKREEEAGALVKQNGGPRGRSHSESREKVLSGKAAASQRHEREKKWLPAWENIKKPLQINFNAKEIKQKFKKNKKQ